MDRGTVTIEAGKTKGRRAAHLCHDARTPELLKERRDDTDAVSVQTGKPCRWVFHRSGKPIESFYDAWKSACEAAEVSGRLLHDLRRTAIRNLIRAGVSEAVAMKMCGHKTRAVFDRYNVTSSAI
jgi:integrase